MKVIPCPHDSGAVADPKQVVSDHHPLTKEDIAKLLDEAKTSDNHRVTQIQVRLCQAIPDYVCPNVIKGPIADKENRINELYIKNFHKGADPELVDILYTIMMQDVN